MNTDADLKKVNTILTKYNQEHLLQFYNELTDEQKDFLIHQILSIKFDEILRLYEKSKFDVYDSTEEIEPIKYTIKENPKHRYVVLDLVNIANANILPIKIILIILSFLSSCISYK